MREMAETLGDFVSHANWMYLGRRIFGNSLIIVGGYFGWFRGGTNVLYPISCMVGVWLMGDWFADSLISFRRTKP